MFRPAPPHDTDDAITSPVVDAAILADGRVIVAPAPDGRVLSFTGGPCRSWEDCRSPGDRCLEPAISRPGRGGGGDAAHACVYQCETDAQCGPRAVCASDYGCVPVQMGGRMIEADRFCEPPCTATSCLPGERCQPDGHCVRIPCSGHADCPDNFACGRPDGPADTCFRRRCGTDNECQGACVNGACYPMPGTCLPHPA